MLFLNEAKGGKQTNPWSHPWDEQYICLHLLKKKQPNVGKDTIHGNGMGMERHVMGFFFRNPVILSHIAWSKKDL